MDAKKLNPHPTLAVVAPGPLTVLRSSGSLGWDGLHVESHTCVPGVREVKDVDRPVLVMLRSATSYGEHRSITGGFVPYKKTHGAFTVIPTGPITELRLLNDSELVYFAFDPSFLKRVYDEMDGPLPPPPFFQSGIHDPQMHNICASLYHELETRTLNEPLYTESLSLALTIGFTKLGGGIIGDARIDDRLSSGEKLARVKELIDANLHGELHLLALAKASGYSRAHFLRWFRSITGTTPHEYVIEQRVDRAQRLLSAPTPPLTEVAALCGFSSQSHMTLAFRKRLGLTPAAYRRLIQR